MNRAIPILLLTALAWTGARVRAELPPGQRVDQLAACLECHDLADDLGARVVHPPAAEGDCASCHNPHVARFAKLLRDQPAPLCMECHGALEGELAKPVVHAPVAEGRCAECHQPHGSANRGLLRQPGSALCASCHAGVDEWKKRKVQHPPFARGDCARCHEPHAAEGEGLLTRSGSALCGSCHEFDAGFRSAHRGFPVERAACETCHDPHASGRAGMLRQNVHEPFAEGSCDSCHVGSGADPFRLVANQPELCGTCHDDVVEASLHATFPHVSAGGGRCTDCHNPHAGEGDALLQRAGNATCLTCHDPGGATGGGEGRYVTHAETLACVTCHSPHGAELPVLLAEPPIALCSGCHEHEHGAAHPLGESTLDPRSGQPMDCTSCHGLHVAPYEKYLQASDERDLCIGCHKSVGRRGGS